MKENTYKNPHINRKKDDDSPYKFKELNKGFKTIDQILETFKPVEINGVKCDPDTGELIEK